MNAASRQAKAKARKLNADLLTQSDQSGASFKEELFHDNLHLARKSTDSGAKSVKDLPNRLDTAKRLLKDMDGEFKSFFLTMGDYDFVAVYEAPDDATAARFTLQLGSLGNVRTKTLKAFPEAAYREIVKSLG